MCAKEDEIFEGERKSLDDEERSGRPSVLQKTTVL
jgi:hypothetical protein